MKVIIILILICVTIFGCDYNRNFISKDSNFREEIIALSDTIDDSEIRNKIFVITPIGSTLEIVKNVIDKNFKKGLRKSPDLPDEYLRVKDSEEIICVRLLESGTFPVGSNWKEAVWFFNKNKQLIEVVVANYGVWM